MTHLHLRESAELVSAVLAEPRPADATLERFFRAHPKMGVRDRATVAEAVYACLRHLRRYTFLSGVDSPTPERLLSVHWLTQGLSARALAAAGATVDFEALALRVRTLNLTALPLAVRMDLPDWLAERLIARLGESEALTLAEALNRPAPMDLRVNTTKGKRETIQAALRDDGITAAPTPYSPMGLRVGGHVPLSRTQVFRDGLIEVQDEGSQLLTLLVEPRRHEMVADFCAGAGGKTLALGALMNGQGTLYAFDVSEKRLARFKPRLKRSGLQNVRSVVIAHERDDRIIRLTGKIDRVLVDAPCSGTGTLRRHPEIKWREIDLDELTARQSRILAAAAELVRPGGRLIYATCSVLDEENTGVVQSFLTANKDFLPVPVNDILARRGVALTMPDTAMQLYPHRHGTDAFYAAVLERSANRL